VAQTESTPESRLLRTATRASVATSVVLVCVKLFAWLSSGSVAVFASLLDSLMDTAASLINLFAVDYSLKPADQDHRFGHGKAEALAGLGQSLFIGASALFLLYQATQRFIAPQPLANLTDAVWVIALALVLTAGLVLFQRYVVKQTGSTAVYADSLHYLSDLATNVATLVALVLIGQGWLRADGLFGIAIGVYILYSAGKVGWVAIRILMDEELPQHERQAIVACVEATDGVLGVQRLRSWRSGQRRVLDIDVLFDGQRLLSDIHANSELVEQRLEDMLPEVDVSIRARPGPVN
jgi:ferrous-iron efflux pump FieF